MFHIEQGSTGWRNMEGLPDEIQAAADLAQKAQDAIDNAAVGSVNLLRNSGFTGDYETEGPVCRYRAIGGYRTF